MHGIQGAFPQLTIQAAGGTVGGTVESARGGEIDVSTVAWLTLFIDYNAGSEGTLDIYPKFYHTSGGSAYPYQDWSTAAGNKTPTDNKLRLTASDNAYYVFDVRPFQFVKFFSQTVGTPTGTLGLFATLSDVPG